MPLLTCPNCNISMNQANRQGIELDICPHCRGVWLDRGELEKLLAPLRDGPKDDFYRRDHLHGHRSEYDDDDDDRPRGRRRGPRSILDIFE